MERIYHHYESWEEYRAGMWRAPTIEEREALLKPLRAIITDGARFDEVMRRVITEWPISCENSETDRTKNRAAWLWHAAACLEIGAPESVTRSLWQLLTEHERIKADREAWNMVYRWEAARQQLSLF